MADFEGRLAAMLDGLRSNDAIEVYDAEPGVLASWLTGPNHALDVIRRVAGTDLAPSMADNFHRYEGLGCYWRFRADGRIGGEFYLHHLVSACVGEVVDGVPDEEWSSSERSTAEWAEAKRAAGEDVRYRLLCNISDVYGPNEEERILNGFDQQGQSGIGGIAGFAAAEEGEEGKEGEEGEEGAGGFATVGGESGQPEIWYSVNTDGTLVRLNLTYPEYLETLLLTRGLFGWQYLYADPHDPGLGYRRTDLRLGLALLEQAFPDDDFSDLRARSDAHLRHRGE
ncbi:hypothetical protein [Yinghuangia sp. YIM S09857]|uniref:hypothetical protein n=1 Tax=Yinghuangia sp. YIM S09857 TaxID=3436929 RepID=UPI003F5385D3